MLGRLSSMSISAGRRNAVIAAAVALFAFAGGLYWLIGGPTDDAARIEDTTAARAGASAVSRDDLVRHLARHPRDGRAWVLLARIDFEADRFSEAAESYRKAIDASPKVATDSGVWCEYADALGMAQGGSLAGRPRELVMRALAQNESHPKALEMAGSAAFEAGEFESALGFWRKLLAQLPPRSNEHAELAAAITRAELLAAAREPAASR